MRCIPAPLALTPTLSQRERGQNRQHGRSAQKRSNQVKSTSGAYEVSVGSYQKKSLWHSAVTLQAGAGQRIDPLRMSR